MIGLSKNQRSQRITLADLNQPHQLNQKDDAKQSKHLSLLGARKSFGASLLTLSIGTIGLLTAVLYGEDGADPREHQGSILGITLKHHKS
jgi:hypothetical protein